MIQGKILELGDNALPDMVNLTLKLLDEDCRIKLLPAAEYADILPDQLRAFCLYTSRYGIPTVELIEWLKDIIGNREAIEVGAGNGDLGYHLGIRQTDSYVQTTPEVQMLMASAAQFPTRPLPDVRRIDAVAAVKLYRPEVVVASWLTRKFIVGKDRERKAQASVYGPEEEKILRGCRMYIHIGNENIHGTKTLLSKPHKVYHFPWLVSRAEDQSKNCIYVWER